MRLKSTGKPVPSKRFGASLAMTFFDTIFMVASKCHSSKTNNRDKMEEGEVFAIETFGSTGKGIMRDDVRMNLSLSPFRSE